MANQEKNVWEWPSCPWCLEDKSIGMPCKNCYPYSFAKRTKKQLFFFNNPYAVNADSIYLPIHRPKGITVAEVQHKCTKCDVVFTDLAFPGIKLCPKCNLLVRTGSPAKPERKRRIPNKKTQDTKPVSESLFTDSSQPVGKSPSEVIKPPSEVSKPPSEVIEPPSDFSKSSSEVCKYSTFPSQEVSISPIKYGPFDHGYNNHSQLAYDNGYPGMYPGMYPYNEPPMQYNNQFYPTSYESYQRWYGCDINPHQIHWTDDYFVGYDKGKFY